MTDMIRATITSNGLVSLRNLYRFCREQRIPIVEVEVHVGAAFEPTMVSAQGSKKRLLRLEELIDARHKMQGKGFYKNENTRLVTTGVLIRLKDYPIVAIYHQTCRQGWMAFLDIAVYGYVR